MSDAVNLEGDEVDIGQLARFLDDLCERLSVALYEAGYPVESISLGFPVDAAVVGNGQLNVELVDPDQHLPDEVLQRALSLAAKREMKLGRRL